jgi:hypothetical protein
VWHIFKEPEEIYKPSERQEKEASFKKRITLFLLLSVQIGRHILAYLSGHLRAPL